MKFLHTADIHLDSAFSSSGATGAEARRGHQRQCLQRIFALARQEQCDFILMAGDIFDTSFVTPETEELCLSLFEDFKKPIIISAGNHDPYVEGSFYKKELPKNVYVFTSSELQYFDFPELSLTVGGYSFTSAALSASPLESQPPRQRTQQHLILCAHADLDAPTSRYAPVMSSDIKRLGFDYAALGHVHNTPAAQDNVRYCGFPEGRSFDERGDGGVLLVTLSDENSLTAERRILSNRRYVWEELSLDGIGDTEEMEKLITDTLLSIDAQKESFVRLTLTGTIPPSSLPDSKIFEEKKPPHISELEIIDSTLAIPDGAFLEKDTTLRGEFYRSLRSGLCSDDPSERARTLYALRIGLAAIDGKSFTEGGKL